MADALNATARAARAAPDVRAAAAAAAADAEPHSSVSVVAAPSPSAAAVAEAPTVLVAAPAPAMVAAAASVALEQFDFMDDYDVDVAPPSGSLSGAPSTSTLRAAAKEENAPKKRKVRRGPKPGPLAALWGEGTAKKREATTEAQTESKTVAKVEGGPAINDDDGHGDDDDESPAATPAAAAPAAAALAAAAPVAAAPAAPLAEDSSWMRTPVQQLLAAQLEGGQAGQGQGQGDAEEEGDEEEEEDARLVAKLERERHEVETKSAEVEAALAKAQSSSSQSTALQAAPSSSSSLSASLPQAPSQLPQRQASWLTACMAAIARANADGTTGGADGTGTGGTGGDGGAAVEAEMRRIFQAEQDAVQAVHDAAVAAMRREHEAALGTERRAFVALCTQQQVRMRMHAPLHSSPFWVVCTSSRAVVSPHPHTLLLQANAKRLLETGTQLQVIVRVVHPPPTSPLLSPTHAHAPCHPCNHLHPAARTSHPPRRTPRSLS